MIDKMTNQCVHYVPKCSCLESKLDEVSGARYDAPLPLLEKRGGALERRTVIYLSVQVTLRAAASRCQDLQDTWLTLIFHLVNLKDIRIRPFH